METKNFKTEQQKKYDDKIRHIILNHCVTCHQQLDLLQLRLINFDDLIKGVRQTIQLTTKQMIDLDKESTPTPSFQPDGEPTKLKKV
jgi:hypothetical protein